jgi:protein-disulfide isomerase
MMRSAKKLRLLIILPCLFGSLHAQDAPYYFLNNKPVSKKDFSPAITQQLYEAEFEKFQKEEQILDNAFLDQHLNTLATTQKKPRAAVEAELFKINVSEKDAEDWYKENKAMLQGREFATIKAEIIPYLTRMKQEKIKVELVAKLKKEQNFRSNLVAPVSPVIGINTEGYPRKGGAKAKVTLVEFADYSCPHCKVASGVLKKVVEKFGEKVAFVFLDFPLHEGSPAVSVAEGGVCADEQGKFWQYHYEAFGTNEPLSPDSPLNFAKKLNLDTTKFTACMQRPSTKEKIASAKQEGVRIGINATPSLYLNGKKQMGFNEAELVKAIESLL